MTHPSQEEERNRDFETRFQAQAKTSRECSDQVAMGNGVEAGMERSKILRVPSPEAVRRREEWDSEKVRS